MLFDLVGVTVSTKHYQCYINVVVAGWDMVSLLQYIIAKYLLDLYAVKLLKL